MFHFKIYKIFGIGIFFVYFGFNFVVMCAGLRGLSLSGGGVLPSSTGFCSGGNGNLLSSVMFSDFFSEMDIVNCAKSEDFSRLEHLVDLDPGVIYVRNVRGWTPLHLAVHFGNYALCKWLMSKGFLVDSETFKSSSTPLMMACFRKNHELIGLFLCNGASVFSDHYKPFTILMVLCQLGDYKAINLVFEHLRRSFYGGEGMNDSDFKKIKTTLFCQQDRNGKTIFDYAQGYADQNNDSVFLRRIGVKISPQGLICKEDPWE